ncbi:MAG: Ig-like domain-containing protein [Bacteroidales bacterium]|nr:Ig-like domain-containing protein [Bacteroidales bacterium]
MKHLLKLLVLSCPLLLAAASCEKYDDTKILDDISSIKSRLTTLEERINALNGNITTLQTLVNSLGGKVFVNSVTKLDDGYIINFSDGKTATIQNGKDGQKGADGNTPVIGVNKDTDGIWYWTIDGKWLTAPDGNKLPVSRSDGISPQLKIEDGNWMLSTDGGKSWEVLGNPVRPVYGAQGRILPSKVTLGNNSLIVTAGHSRKLSATVFPGYAENKDIIWKSDDPAIATVSSEGEVTAVSEGETVIIVSTEEGDCQDICHVLVYAAVEPEMVDLGLSVKWASFNVGASVPFDKGDTFAWGETYNKYDGTWDKYLWRDNNSGKFTKYCQADQSARWQGDGAPDGKTVLDPEDDAASVAWGNGWSMPTGEEVDELFDQNNCSFSLEIVDGIQCCRLVSKKPGFTDKSITLRLDNIYWTSTLFSDPRYAYSFFGWMGESEPSFTVFKAYRRNVLPDRPVHD